MGKQEMKTKGGIKRRKREKETETHTCSETARQLVHCRSCRVIMMMLQHGGKLLRWRKFKVGERVRRVRFL